MNIPRRSFLAQAGVGVFGFSAWACPEECPAPDPGKGVPPAPPKPLADALARGRAEDKPVILLRIPEDPEARHWPGHLAIALVYFGPEESPELLSEVVLLCVESATIRRHVPGADPAHSLLLLDAEGKAIEGKPCNYSGGVTTLLSEIRTLAHGADGTRLKERAAGIRRKTNPQVLAALDRLGTGDAKPEDKAVLLLEAPKILPLIVQSKLEAPTKIREQALRDLIDTYYSTAPRNSPGPQLPFGVDTQPYVPSCGTDHCKEQPPEALERRRVVGCGMAAALPNARMFLRYLTQ